MHHHLFSQHPYDGHLGCNPHRYQVWYDVKSLLLVQFLNICHIPIRHLGKSIEFKIVQRVLFKFTMYYMINRFCVLFHSIPMPSCTLAPSLKGEHVFQRFGDRHEGAGDLIFHPACMIFKSHHLKKGRAWGKTNNFPLVTAEDNVRKSNVDYLSSRRRAKTDNVMGSMEKINTKDISELLEDTNPQYHYWYYWNHGSVCL